jgi:hypothetical protein
MRNDVLSAIETFEAITSTTKRTEKESLLFSIQSNKYAKRLVKLAIGSKQFYVKPPKLSALPKSKHSFSDIDLAYAAFLELTSKLMEGKIVGNEARSNVETFLSQCQHLKLAQKWFHAILEKKLRMGVDTAIQKVWPGLVVPFGVCKGLALVEQKSGKMVERAKKMIHFPCGSQPKKDGFNVSFRCEGDVGTALSSDNVELPVLKPWADAIAKVVGTLSLRTNEFPEDSGAIIVDGEAEAIFNAEDIGHWKSAWGKASALVKAGLKKTGYDPKTISKEMKVMLARDLRITLYDIYPEIAHGQACDIPYMHRYQLCDAIVFNVKKNVLRTGLNQDVINVIEMAKCKTWEELKTVHDVYIKRGEEGSIIRMFDTPVRADSKWRGNYVKWKEHTKVDAVIIGVEEGRGKNAGRAGAFVCWIPKKKAITRVTVPNDKAKQIVWKYRESLGGYFIEFVQQADTKGGNASTFPVFARFRHDQPPMLMKEVGAVALKSKIDMACLGQLRATKLVSVAEACNKSAK